MKLNAFIESPGSSMARTSTARAVYMASSAFLAPLRGGRAPGITFADIKDYQRAAA